jgi:hypothetical protein
MQLRAIGGGAVVLMASYYYVILCPCLPSFHKCSSVDHKTSWVQFFFYNNFLINYLFIINFIYLFIYWYIELLAKFNKILEKSVEFTTKKFRQRNWENFGNFWKFSQNWGKKKGKKKKNIW